MEKKVVSEKRRVGMFDRESLRVVGELLNVCFKAVVVSFVVQYMEERRRVQTGEVERNRKEFSLTLVLIVTLVGLVNSLAIFLASTFGYSKSDLQQVAKAAAAHAVRASSDAVKGALGAAF